MENNDVPEFLYRFRPIQIVPKTVIDELDKQRIYFPTLEEMQIIPKEKTVIDELDKQEIYFSTLEEKNDPLDGRAQIYWEGDDILWNNFIDHYLLCLFGTINITILIGNDSPIGYTDVNTWITPDEFKHTDLYLSFFSQMNNASVTKSFRKIFTKGRKLYREQLSLILFLFHIQIIELALKLFEKDYKWLVPPTLVSKLSKKYTYISRLFPLFNQLPEKFFRTISEFCNNIKSEIFMLIRYNAENKDNICAANRLKVLTQFPDLYLTSLIDRPFFPPCTASFTTSVEDISLWSHYAENHKGICLQFKTLSQDSSLRFKLRSNKAAQFYKVKYGKFVESNYFTSILHLPMAKLKKYWLQREKKSSVYSKYYKQEEFHKNYWEGFLDRMCRKHPMFQSEQEYRLIEVNMFPSDSPDPTKGKIDYYEFQALSGIIFGLHTPEKEKLEIMHIIENKIKAHKVNSFKFYQATYSERENKITINELKSLKFRIT